MADSEITVTAAQFAQKIKDEFPQYATVPDDGLLDLVEWFIQKNPQYRPLYRVNDGGSTLVSVSWDSPEAAPVPSPDEPAGAASAVPNSTVYPVPVLAAEESTEANSKAEMDSGTTVGRRYVYRKTGMPDPSAPEELSTPEPHTRVPFVWIAAVSVVLLTLICGALLTALHMIPILDIVLFLLGFVFAIKGLIKAFGKTRNQLSREANSHLEDGTQTCRAASPGLSAAMLFVIAASLLLCTVALYFVQRNHIPAFSSADYEVQKGINSRAEELYQEGVDLQAAGKLSEAKAAFEKVVQQLPTSTSVSAAQEKLTDVNAAIARFGAEQNDSEGYDGKAWGLKSNPTGSLDGEDRELLGLVFNLPIKTTIVAGANLGESLDMGLLPELSVEPVGETSYVFYRGELAMALVKLDAHNYDSVKAAIESKGFHKISENSKNYRELGDASDGDSTGPEAVLYKRGNTNTRVYLMKHIDRSPYGASFSAYLLYMPNHYYNLISTETTNTQNQRNLDATHAAEQRAEPDTQKVQ